MSFAAKKKAVMALIVTGSNVNGGDGDFTSCGSVLTGDGGGTATPGVSVSGGSGSYTYLWTQIGTPATAGPYTPSNATSQNPTWSKYVCDGDAINTETWRLTVTDVNTGVTGTLDIFVTLTWANYT